MVTQLDIENLSLSFGSFQALKDIQCSFSGGEIVALLGPNGAGKSTLLRSINQILQPNTGEVRLNGQNVSEFTPTERAQNMAYVPQRDELRRPSSVFDAVLLGRMPHFGLRPRSEDYDHVHEALKKFDLEHLAHREILELSGGQRQRVIIARAFVQKPKLLLIDEPTANLDIKYQLHVLEILRQIQEPLILVAIHDLNLALRFATHFLLLHEGRILSQGTTAELKEEMIQTAFGVSAKRIEHHGQPWLIID